MKITNIKSWSKPENEAVDLEVSSSGLVVAVGAGSVVLGGVSYTLAEDANAALVADPSHESYATIYLCKELATGVLKAVVDELVADPDVTPLPYEFKGSPYGLLFQLAYIKMEAAITSLDDAPTIVWSIVPKPQEEE